MNQEAQLKLQAYLDGELPAGERAAVEAWLACDAEAQLLLAELQNTGRALDGHGADVKLPETREFFWSKIEREIERQEQPEPVISRHQPVSVFWWLRQWVPFSGVAALVVLLMILVVHPGQSNAGQFGEMEIAADSMGADVFRDQEQKMTMVWFYDRSGDSQFTESSPLATVNHQ
ncbi:MAG: putative transrane anti-sigma factor [Pedosphaera sp.]|nr:putative transrane anti-sigma factor [Pedosphaera sp.]